jgi:flagellar assembly factor FliW
MTAESELATENFIVHSRWLGDIVSDPRAALFFPSGIPGFEEERRMLPIEIPSQRPLVYLQSLSHPEICFAALPVFVIDPGFRLSLSEDEQCALDFPEGSNPVIGVDVLCLALLMSPGEGVRVNLNAPVVINLHNSRGVQSVSADQTSGCFGLASTGHWEAQC